MYLIYWSLFKFYRFINLSQEKTYQAMRGQFLFLTLSRRVQVLPRVNLQLVRLLLTMYRYQIKNIMYISMQCIFNQGLQNQIWPKFD